MTTIKRNALGRGLDALITMDDVKTGGSSSINEIKLSLIKPNPGQPRQEFDEESLNELAASIRELGIIQPITLRQMPDDSYQIISGERRYRASLLAGLETIPAYVRTVEDETVMEMALIENIQREDLNPVEIALTFQKLIEQYHLTPAQRARREKTGNDCQLPETAETSRRNTNRVKKQTDRYGSCTSPSLGR